MPEIGTVSGARLQGGDGWARVLAGLIALAAWAGIAIHFHALASGAASWAGALWTLIGYFTITTNLLVAIVFTGVTLRSTAFESSWLLGGTLLSILLVGVVYALLLRGLRELTAGSEVANILLHQTTPFMVTVFWLAFVRKGALTWRDPLLWALYPLGYFFYALPARSIRGTLPLSLHQHRRDWLAADAGRRRYDCRGVCHRRRGSGLVRPLAGGQSESLKVQDPPSEAATKRPQDGGKHPIERIAHLSAYRQRLDMYGVEERRFGAPERFELLTPRFVVNSVKLSFIINNLRDKPL
ncbi:MAG TPA: Pr6Pr family membrane protein [Pseudaminobacter sp.]|nr:Pr6Pr family membrane protein [Pseudaminobacter sp.]